MVLVVVFCFSVVGSVAGGFPSFDPDHSTCGPFLLHGLGLHSIAHFSISASCKYDFPHVGSIPGSATECAR
eukprot:3608016-Amphidinium_carterae.1